MVLEDSKKSQTFIAFFKLFLRDVKVETLWISWHFFAVFWMHPVTGQSLAPSFFSEMKGTKVVHMSCKFHLHLTCSSWLFSLQVFSYLQKVRGKSPLNSSFPLSFPLEKWRYIRESTPCLPKLHPSGTQVKKTFSNEIRFLSVIQEVKGVQRILIDFKWAGNNLDKVKVL